MVRIGNFLGQNGNLNIVEQKGCFSIIEHQTDLSVAPSEAGIKYYMSMMNCTPKQLMIQLNNNGVKLHPGAMQFMTGQIQQTSGITGVGDFLGKALKSKVTNDAAIKPEYVGTGIVMCEPTYMFPIIEDVSKWGGMVCDDGMFLCCEKSVQESVVMRSNFSSAVAGNEGLFNTCLSGNGLAVIKSKCPREELYELILENDCVKIDGNMAVAWSSSLEFTVERSGKSLIGSAASGEGLVNVYRGTGRILMQPLP